MERIYFIQSECNDHGWMTGFYYFKKRKDAVTTMRRYVARKIRLERADGNKVEYFHIWKNSVMGSCGKEDAISITFKVTNKEHDVFFWDFRIWCADLLDEPLEKRKCFNF